MMREDGACLVTRDKVVEQVREEGFETWGNQPLALPSHRRRLINELVILTLGSRQLIEGRLRELDVVLAVGVLHDVDRKGGDDP